MPIGETHRRKRGKNFFALGVLLVFIGGLFYLTMLKVGGV
jgi:hypothetical protein